MPGERLHSFLCDAMLGSLCRWLRFAGFDAEYAGVRARDEDIQKSAEMEGRWLLTMDRLLASRGPRCLLLQSNTLETQLREVFSRLQITPDSSLASARCGVCNGCLETVDRSGLENLVPPHALKTAPHFRRCRQCGRIYWPGSHTEKIRRLLAKFERLGD